MQDDDPGLAALVGAWRLRSVGVTWSDNGERMDVYGPNPDGYMVLEPSGRIMFIFGPRERRPPEDDSDRAGLFVNLTAYTGRIRLDGPGRFVTVVDYAWNPAWVGEQLRFFRLFDNRLEIRSPEQTHPSYGSRKIVADLLWEREQSRTTAHTATRALR